ncbi:MAG: hypothetical protein CSB24_03035 [Deltaproteobacteria bacterium]|nr:MAG: hypothetical protein CSB24_03035 [Deltaproteobacteria bacterium]
MEKQLDSLFSHIPAYEGQGYSLSNSCSRQLTKWLDALIEAAADDAYLQEEIMERLLCSSFNHNQLNRFYCTLALKLYQAISGPKKKLQWMLTGTCKKMLNLEQARILNLEEKQQIAARPMVNHYCGILNEYLEFLAEKGNTPPYLDYQARKITDAASYRRLFFESPRLGRELYCDLWYHKSTEIMLYHLTGYASKSVQQERRHTYPDNFSSSYLDLLKLFPENRISLCIISCPYEDVYPAFVKQFMEFMTKELFVEAEKICGYGKSGRGISSFSKGGYYTCSLLWQMPIADAAVINSGAQMEIFTRKLEEKELPAAKNPFMITCGNKDDFYQNNLKFYKQLKQQHLTAQSCFYDGNHQWPCVEPVFNKGLEWLVKTIKNYG